MKAIFYRSAYCLQNLLLPNSLYKSLGDIYNLKAKILWIEMTNGKTTKIWHNFRKNLQKLEKSKENYVQNNYDICKKEYENKLFPNQSVLTLLVKTSQPN